MEGKISESEWKRALTSIIEELEDDQYKKMLSFLNSIPQSEKSRSSKQVPQIIIQHLGVERSICEMERVLQEIPRRDATIQDLLRPFVVKLKNKQQQDTNTGNKRKHATASEDERSAGQRKSSRVESKKSKMADQQRKDQGDKDICPSQGKSESLMKTICDLKESRHLGSNLAIAGKVVRKSGLRPYQTKSKEKALFHLGLADDTDCIKVTVYGKQRYEEIKEGSCYLFRNVNMENHIVKVTSSSKISQTSTVRVPAHLQLEARMIIDPQKPLCSIKEAKTSRDQTELSVQGTITKMNPGEAEGGPQRTAVQRVFHLQDDTGSIRICLSGAAAAGCTASVGDSVMVTNVRSDHDGDAVSLSSTGTSRVEKIEAVSVQTGTVEITGIFKTSKTSAKLEAVFGHQMKTLVVKSKLLATTFNIRLEDNFMERLLDKMPLFGQAEIHRNKITAIKKM